jgi:lipoprotein-releasing system ATP-binding protein
MSNLAVNVNGLFKSFGYGPQKVEVLKGVDLQVKNKEVAIIMGPSGVGKSTLLHVLGLLDKADNGTILIAGKDVSNLNEKSMARMRNKNIGFVFQFHHLLPEFSALENVLMPAMIYGNGDETREYALHLLNLVGLSHRLNHKPAELSGGEQQRVAVARAIINKPGLVLADEPTGNLDKMNGEALFNLLLKLNNELGLTLLIVTHNDHMTASATRIIELEDGKILRQTFPS